MIVAEDWGADQNAWLVQLSYTVAIVSGVFFLLFLAFLFRVPLFRLIEPALRPLRHLLIPVKFVVRVTPLHMPLRRYMYTPRHLQEA